MKGLLFSLAVLAATIAPKLHKADYQAVTHSSYVSSVLVAELEPETKDFQEDLQKQLA